MFRIAAQPSGSSDEERLGAFGLSSTVLHNGLRRGAERAANRSAAALPSSAGTDVYHDGMEDLTSILQESGWQRAYVEGQPRLLHPEELMSFAVSSGTNVGRSDLRATRTNQKGPATRRSLAFVEDEPGLFDDIEAALTKARAEAASRVPFYFLLCERVAAGTGMMIELAQPAVMNTAGNVLEWADRIEVQYLDLTGTLNPGHESAGDEFDVPVEPR